MRVPELVKVAIAGLVLGEILGALGASTGVILACAIGMGITWKSQ